MATFNQQGQHVKNQYNAENIYIGDIHSNSDLIAELQQFITLVDQAVIDGSIEEPTAVAVKKELENVIVHVSEPAIEKTTLMKHLTKAQEILKGFTAAEGLAETLKQLIKSIANWFL